MEKRFERVPLHKQVAEYLRKYIKDSYQPGDKLAAESRLARELDVSLVTLREALGTLAQEGLIERRQGAGTFVRELEDSRHVAVFCPLDITHPEAPYFFGRVTQRSRQLLQERGIANRLYVGNRMPTGKENPVGVACEEFVNDAEKGGLSGVIAAGTSPALKDWETLRRLDIPVVGGVPGLHNIIRIDMPTGIRKGVENLVGRGCRRIAFISAASPELRSVFQETLRQYDVQLCAEFVVEEAPLQKPGFGYEAFRRLWNAGEVKPDGVLVAEDILYPEVAMGLLEKGVRVPEDVAVATHTNKGASMHFPFPTICLMIDPEEWAQYAVEIIERGLNGNTQPSSDRTIYPEVVESQNIEKYGVEMEERVAI